MFVARHPDPASGRLMVAFYVSFSNTGVLMPPEEGRELGRLELRIRSLAQPERTPVDFLARFPGTGKATQFVGLGRQNEVPVREGAVVEILGSELSALPDLLTCIQEFESAVLSWENPLPYEAIQVSDSGFRPGSSARCGGR